MAEQQPPQDVPRHARPTHAERQRRRRDWSGPETMHLDAAPQLEAEPEDWLGSPHDGRPTWLVPVTLVVLFAALVVGAYVAGRLFAATVGDVDVRVAEPVAEPGGVAAAPFGAGPGRPSAGQAGDIDDDGAGREAKPKPYRGPTVAVPISAATATCQARSSVDAAGNPVGYAPRFAFDEDVTTAWRCAGDGVGESLTLTVPRGTRIGEVGLVPGYAKTDPRTGADRYAENNRITRVRWRFDDGTAVVQKLNGSPRTRRMQFRAVPPTVSRTVVLEVRASRPGPRDTIAVSEIRIGGIDG